MMNQTAHFHVKTLDYWIAGLLLVLSFSFWIPMKLNGSQTGERVKIIHNGQTRAMFSLSTQRIYEFEGMTIQIQDNGVQVSHSDCPHQICVRSGRIAQQSQTIVCVPNKVLIEISGSNDTSQLNAVSY